MQKMCATQNEVGKPKPSGAEMRLAIEAVSMYNGNVRSSPIAVLCRVLLLLALVLPFFSPSVPGGGNGTFSLRPAFAQSAEDDLTDADYAAMGEAGPIVRQIRADKSTKTIVLIFDISGSMKGTGMMRRARQAAIHIVNKAARRADTVRLLTFGPTYSEFDRTIQSGADRREILDQIPFETGMDTGTNIRRPHHLALKHLNEHDPDHGVIVLLTDSFNDQPRKDNPAYAEYTRYYVPGQLNKYPNTPENQSYESLLKKLVVSGRVKQFGVGVEFGPNGRPIERNPQDALPPIDAPATPAPTMAEEPVEPPNLTLLWVLLGLGALGLIGLLVVVPLLKPVSVRISGAGSSKDFQVSGSQTIRLGGDGANFAPDAYPIPGVATVVATVRASGGKMTILPPTPVGNEKPTVRVYHNGLPLEAPAPLMYGDEVKVTVPQAEGVPKDFRLKFSDPRATS